MSNLLLTYYGDDLTGSTDSMEALELGGVPTVLFLMPPTPEQLARFPDARAVGLAGISRTMTPDEMDTELPPAFDSLKNLDAPLTHYKVCSTFDSSPEIGSIGRAAEIGKRIFSTLIVPVMVGAPKLRRYVVFGNHFATAGDETYRLDRHPTMSKHPITPMDESDLRLHLSRQTTLEIDLIDVRHLEETDQNIHSRLRKMKAKNVDIVILDTMDKMHLLKVGRLMWELGVEQNTFVVGSSGVEFSLTEHLQNSGELSPLKSFNNPGPVDQILAISGSAAPKTAVQIQDAVDKGFVGLRLNCANLIDPDTVDETRKKTIQEALDIIQNGKSLILYSALGPEDEHIAKTKERMSDVSVNPKNVGEILGKQQGLILKEILLNSEINRFAVAGGDTSGNVLKQLEVYVLEFLIPLGTATPLCRAGSQNPELDGLEVALKGGQLGEIDFFERVLQGRMM